MKYKSASYECCSTAAIKIENNKRIMGSLKRIIGKSPEIRRKGQKNE